MKNLLLFTLIMSILSGCGLRPSPESAYKNIVKYSSQKDWASLYDSHTAHTKQQLSIAIADFANGLRNQGQSSLTDKKIFVKWIELNGSQGFEYLPGYKVISTKKNENKALLSIKDPNGEVQDIIMVLENGEWKLSLEAMIDDAHTSLAQINLKTIANSVETYANANGAYPTSVGDLRLANPPYAGINHCGQTESSYHYRCDINTGGYVITATPIRKGNLNEYSITTGGIISSN